MRLELTQRDANLERFGNGLGALGEFRARQVLARALNRTGGPTLTAVRRQLAVETSAPMRLIRLQVKGRKAWAGTADGAGKLEYVIEATGSELPLKLFRPVEFRWGVRAKVWGRMQRFEGAFMRGGVFPDRVELPAMFGHVMHRTSAARLPVEISYGPSLAKELVEAKVVAVFNAKVVRLADDVAHELDRELMLA